MISILLLFLMLSCCAAQVEEGSMARKPQQKMDEWKSPGNLFEERTIDSIRRMDWCSDEVTAAEKSAKPPQLRNMVRLGLLVNVPSVLGCMDIDGIR